MTERMVRLLFSDLSTMYEKDDRRHDPQQRTKETLLIDLYRNYKDDMLSYVDGEFSFALYDDVNETYIGARDPLGIKAFYYTRTAQGYHFSSNISELLKIPGVDKKPNLSSMRTMLYERAVDYHQTMYEGIHRLPPGHYIKGTKDKIEIKRYWFPEKIKIDYSITVQEASEKIKKLLAAAISKRVNTLDKTAFEVSGGLDSSSVVSLFFQKHREHTIDTYSMKFNGLDCDESDYVESILSKYPLNHQYIPTEKLDYKQRYSLKNLYKISPNWPITTTFAMSLPMLEKMKDDGKRAVVTGQGGDHLFTGSPYVYYDLFRRLKFVTLYHGLKNEYKPWAKIKKFIIKPFLGKRITAVIIKMLGRESLDPFTRFQADIINLSDQAGIINPLTKNELDMVTSAGQSTMLDGNLFHAAEAYLGIEFRHPFFDKELVEFALSLPPEMKYKKRTIKWILREAMKGILPEKIRTRKDKAEFTQIIRQQINAIDQGMFLDDPCIVRLGLVEQSEIDRYRREYKDNISKHILHFWAIINIEYWYRYNFEEETL